MMIKTMYQRVTNYKQLISSALLTVMLLFAQTLYAVHSPQTFYEHAHSHHHHDHELNQSICDNHVTDHNTSGASHTHHTQTSAQCYEYSAIVPLNNIAIEPAYAFSSIPFINTPPKRPPRG